LSILKATATVKISRLRAVKLPLLVIFSYLSVMGTFPATAEESAPTELLRHISPDKKFAVRVLCHHTPKDPSNLDADNIKALDLISLPGKEVVGSLTYGGYDGFKLLWASDSKWCAFYSMSGTRQGETSVYRLQGDKFVQLETGEMEVPVKGDVRNQYLEPLRWLKKPGTLVLSQFTIFRGTGDSTIELTVRFDGNGKFHVISKRKKS
jgi:hypothetical protein